MILHTRYFKTVKIYAESVLVCCEHLRSSKVFVKTHIALNVYVPSLESADCTRISVGAIFTAVRRLAPLERVPVASRNQNTLFISSSIELN